MHNEASKDTHTYTVTQRGGGHVRGEKRDEGNNNTESTRKIKSLNPGIALNTLMDMGE